MEGDQALLRSWTGVGKRPRAMVIARETLAGVGVALSGHPCGRRRPQHPHTPSPLTRVSVWSPEDPRHAVAPRRPGKPAPGSQIVAAWATADPSVSPRSEASGKAIPQPRSLGRIRGNICAGEHLSVGCPFGVLAPLAGRAGSRGEGSGQPARPPCLGLPRGGRDEVPVALASVSPGTRCGICNGAEKGLRACPGGSTLLSLMFLLNTTSLATSAACGSSWQRCCHFPTEQPI